MSDAVALTAIILTMNEEQHITRCIESVRGICDYILVIDSGSTDRTCEIAESLGADVRYNRFVSHAGQVNQAIDWLAGRGGWLFRIDADETIPPESRNRLLATIAGVPQEVAGISLRRQIIFLGKRIRWGGIEPNPQLRLWREGRGRSEQRWMDEHIIVTGRVSGSNLALVDENLNSISWWTTKHNNYASREAVEILLLKHDRAAVAIEVTGSLAPLPAAKRWIKEHLYAKLPRPVRSTTYFLLRYFVLLGFLDGRAGFYFHALQGFWYRSLVDAKIVEVEQAMQRDGLGLAEAIETRLGIAI